MNLNIKVKMTAKKITPKTRTGQRLMEMFELMFAHFGPRHWWPGETALEVIVGAVLTQNTNWKNVEKAITNLKESGLLSLKALCSVSADELALEIRPAGYYNIKAGRLKNLISFVENHYGGNLGRMLEDGTAALRQGLLSVNGIGPETADSIILYGANCPIFVIDAYTHRILKRHGMAEDEATYHDLQEMFMDNLPEDVSLFNEFHALIVETGKDYCRKNPLCDKCPLSKWGQGIYLS
ncbi:conserved hypothetical protein [uncultured Desulfobacterium sp.]|uniref:HhH-GPD domain-containing protein n=1 Tax=uncultured Desulfobacterium sp. TaxID=201089 RepID=A0A445N2W8_9BACT|nr:conserved hypothetical protein [uncultured Desulfobacterium sp.]